MILFRSPWGRLGLVMVVMAAMTGALMLAGEARTEFFISAKLYAAPFVLLFMLWALFVIFGALLIPQHRRTRVSFAGGVILMFAGLFRELDGVTPLGLTQAFLLVSAVTWMGFGGGGMDGRRDEGSSS